MVTEPYYRDDFVTLYHGDCLEHPEWWVDADVLVTDPPYGVAWRPGAVAYDPEVRTRATASIKNDESTNARDEVLTLWGKRPALVFGSWRMPRPHGTINRLIWYKVKTFPAVRPGPWFSAEEEIYVLGKGWVGPPSQNVYPTTRMMAANHGLVAEIGHPTPKPVGLMEMLIEKCPPGVIVDPFAGSGSTLVAAKGLQRKAVGVELEERYCEIAAKRLSQGVLDLWERGR